MARSPHPHREPALAVAAIAIAAALPLGCGGDDDASTEAEEGRSTPQSPAEEQPFSPGEERGRELFIANCGSCHTLDAAGTQGQVGPNLDELQVDGADVLTAIEIGGRGDGVMPKNLVEGAEAEEVAAFVAASGP